MQGDKPEKTSFKDQALLNQAKNAYQNKHTDQAIECVSQAIELNETKVELYLFRSRCYASIARTAEAIQDAEKAIQLEAEEMKLSPGLQLCGGFYARAEAKFLSGDFEEALVDYNRCAARRHDVLYNQGIDKAQFNIRKAFEFTGSQVRIAEQALLKGVLLEAETRMMTFAPEATLVRFPTFQLPDDDVSITGGAGPNQGARAGSRGSCMTPGGHPENGDVLVDLSNREMLLPTAQIHYILVKEARKNPMYQKLQKLTEDKTFLEFIEPMPNLAATCQKAITFINEREKYWKDQNHQNLDINEIKPQPERRTKSVKNMKDFAKYSALRKQQRLALMQGMDKNVTFAKMEESRKVFYQKSAQQIREQNQAVEEQQNEDYFELVLLNIEECIGSGCDSLAMEFVREFFTRLSPPASTCPVGASASASAWGAATAGASSVLPGAPSAAPAAQNSPEYKPYFLQALQIKALLLIHQGAYKDARDVFSGLDHTKMPRQFILLFQRLNAIILCKMGQIEEGLLALESLLQEPGLDAAFQLDVKILLASIYGESGRYQQALDCCRSVYRPLRTQAEAHGETTIYKLDKEVQLYNKYTVTEVFVKVLQIEAEALKELKMDLEHAEKVREIKKVQKRLG